MNKFLVMVEGGNCVIRGLSKSHSDRYGFYATRYVETTDQRLAERLALQMIESEVVSKKMILNDNSDPPVFRVEKTQDIVELTTDVSVKGFTFFHEDGVDIH